MVKSDSAQAMVYCPARKMRPILGLGGDSLACVTWIQLIRIIAMCKLYLLTGHNTSAASTWNVIFLEKGIPRNTDMQRKLEENYWRVLD